ncbi:MAG: hypothetical protein AAF678_00345 [Pseudomonadota bacterium]
MAGAGGVALADAQQASAASDTPLSAHTAHASGGAGVVDVDAFGAVGDCPRTGSTSGATDDSDAIEAALRAVPDAGIVRFTPGRCYLVSRPIEVTGKSMALQARGATIRCGDDSVWHVFTLGGQSADAPVDEVIVDGGTWDGNLARQRYWPNEAGTLRFTDQGVEASETATGSPFYENSAVNGLSWVEGWLDGSAGDGVYVNGEGNKGLVRVQHAASVRFLHARARDYVRNAFVTWNCAEQVFLACSSTGQLPTTFFELHELFGKGYEAAFIKVVGENTALRPLRGQHGYSVRVIGGRVEGGAMPFFMRIQGQKPISSGSFCAIDGFEAYGIARELWFEDCASVRISNSQIVCHPAGQSTLRNDPAIFFSNRTHDWVISNCYVRGRINSNENQDRRFGVIESTILDSDAKTDQWLVECDTISSSLIRSSGRGAVCRRATNSEFLAETKTALTVEEEASACRIGADRREGRTERFMLSEGDDRVNLSGVPAGLTHLRIRNVEVMGGRWFDIHKANFKLDGAEVRLVRGSSPFAARAGDEIEVSWYEADALRLPYAGLQSAPGPGAACRIDVIARNTRPSRLRGKSEVKGYFEDIAGEAAFWICDATQIDMKDLTLKRVEGAIMACKRTATVGRLILRGCWFEDWGQLGDKLPERFRRPFVNVEVTDVLQLTQTSFLQSGVKTRPVTNKGEVALLIEGANSYSGLAKPANFKGVQVLRQPDFGPA